MVKPLSLAVPEVGSCACSRAPGGSGRLGTPGAEARASPATCLGGVARTSCVQSRNSLIATHDHPDTKDLCVIKLGGTDFPVVSIDDLVLAK